MFKFGESYQADANDAMFVSPRLLRQGQNGAVTILDGKKFVRSLHQGRVRTIVCATSDYRLDFVDVWPLPEGDGRLLIQTDGGIHLTRFSTYRQGEADATFKPPAGAGQGEDSHPVSPTDGMVPLSGGDLLICAYGQLWRYGPTGQPRLILGAQAPEAWESGEPLGSRWGVSADDKVYFAGKRRIYQVSLEDGGFTAIAGKGTALLAGDMPDDGLIHVTGIALTPQNDLLVVDNGARQVKTIPRSALP